MEIAVVVVLRRAKKKVVKMERVGLQGCGEGIKSKIGLVCWREEDMGRYHNNGYERNNKPNIRYPIAYG